MAMVFPAYDTYDSYGHLPISRRQSMAYGNSYPYGQGPSYDPMYEVRLLNIHLFIAH